MERFDRREVMLGGALTVAWGTFLCGCGVSHAQTFNGCFVSDPDADKLFEKSDGGVAFATGNEELRQTSGDKILDRALARALTTLSRSFSVLPGFAFYDDSSNPNALATDKNLLENTDGTVLFGEKFLESYLSLPSDRDAAIVSICAHEFAHIVAYKTLLYGQLVPDISQPFRGEQHADYLAGFFAGQRKLLTPTYPAIIFLTTLKGLAGGKHGTKKQRERAVAEGFKAGFVQGADFNDGIQSGFEFAMN